MRAFTSSLQNTSSDQTMRRRLIESQYCCGAGTGTGTGIVTLPPIKETTTISAQQYSQDHHDYIAVDSLTSGNSYMIIINILFTATTIFSFGSLRVGLYDKNDMTGTLLGVITIDPRNIFVTSADFQWTCNVSGMFVPTGTTAWVRIDYSTIVDSIPAIAIANYNYNIYVIQT